MARLPPMRWAICLSNPFVSPSHNARWVLQYQNESAGPLRSPNRRVQNLGVLAMVLAVGRTHGDRGRTFGKNQAPAQRPQEAWDAS
jgi:hypothetical protein